VSVRVYAEDLVNDLIYLWSQNLNRLLGGGGTVEGGAWLERIDN
jgi:hypothetical protein